MANLRSKIIHIYGSRLYNAVHVVELFLYDLMKNNMFFIFNVFYLFIYYYVKVNIYIDKK